MYGDIYPATTQLFDAAIQAHYRLPPHHRTASMTLLYAADILIFAFGVPIKETEQAVQHPDL